MQSFYTKDATRRKRVGSSARRRRWTAASGKLAPSARALLRRVCRRAACSPQLHPRSTGYWARMVAVQLALGALLLDAAIFLPQAITQQPSEQQDSGGESLAVRRLPRDRLLCYLDDNGEEKPITAAAQWPLRRQQILDAMQTIMGRLPTGEQKRRPLDMHVEEEVDCGSYVRQLITYASEPGCRVPAYLLIPKHVIGESQRAVPAVLCLHGTDHRVGHGTVVGLGDRPNRQYAAELAERGFVTLAPNYPLLAKYQPDLASLGWESGTLKAVWDNMRGLDLLESLPFVRGGKFGAIGHSLGGHNAVFTAAFDERIVAVVSNCGLDLFVDYYGGDPARWEPEQGWTQTRYMPKLRHYQGRLAEIPFDFHEVIAAIAPRRLLIIAPQQDDNFRADSVDRLTEAARPVFELLDAASSLQVEHPPCGHDFPTEVREQAYAFLKAALD